MIEPITYTRIHCNNTVLHDRFYHFLPRIWEAVPAPPPGFEPGPWVPKTRVLPVTPRRNDVARPCGYEDHRSRSGRYSFHATGSFPYFSHRECTNIHARHDLTAALPVSTGGYTFCRKVRRMPFRPVLMKSRTASQNRLPNLYHSGRVTHHGVRRRSSCRISCSFRTTCP